MKNEKKKEKTMRMIDLRARGKLNSQPSIPVRTCTGNFNGKLLVEFFKKSKKKSLINLDKL